MSTEVVNSVPRSALAALRSPRGRYGADRASQLSGVPRSTLYDWQRHGIYDPDFRRSSPMAWSYRDLVLVRLLAWLRQRGFDRPEAARRVAWCKRQLAAGVDIESITADGHTFLVNFERTSRFEGDDVPLPFESIRDLLRTFELLEPISELGVHKLWGPDLVTPSPRTTITATVMGGEPCVAGTRIPTSALYALHHERGLDARSIARLYPAITSEGIVGEAIQLENRLRRAA